GSCEVRVGGAAVEAAIYLPEEDTWPVGAPWSLADWQAAHGALTREAAREYMHLIDTHAPTDAARSFPQVRSRASSRLRARAAPSPVAFDGAPGGAVVERTVQPYTDYFAIQEDWLRIPRFDGSLAPAVKRACFLGGDAVTVVPFDPATQSVLVVRQFRHGPHARGDANPWCVEPPAGRIDAGETAEDAARRELLEETGITASALHLVAAYYPTPGAYSEHLTSYVAIADLSGADGRVGGVATEAEDIMSHVIPLDHLMALVGNGGANTGPLILTAQWLALHADTLG
ncbi:MAG: NUDIX hydrolase, partial [Pseudomonadota bacterium]